MIAIHFMGKKTEIEIPEEEHHRINDFILSVLPNTENLKLKIINVCKNIYLVVIEDLYQFYGCVERGFYGGLFDRANNIYSFEFLKKLLIEYMYDVFANIAILDNKNINSKDEDNLTLLQSCIKNGDEICTELLLKLGAEDIPDIFGLKAADLSLKYDNAKIYGIIVSTMKITYNSLHYTMKNIIIEDRIDFFEFLCEYFIFSDQAISRLLFYCLRNKSLKCTDFLIERIPDSTVKYIIYEGLFDSKYYIEMDLQILYDYLMKYDHFDFLKRTMKFGVIIYNIESMNPIFTAVKYKRPEMVKLFSDLGYDKQVPIKNEYPLHKALENGDLESVRILYDEKLFENRVKSNLLMKLTLKEGENYLECTKFLLEQGIKIGQGRSSPLTFCKNRGLMEHHELFLKYMQK